MSLWDPFFEASARPAFNSKLDLASVQCCRLVRIQPMKPASGKYSKPTGKSIFLAMETMAQGRCLDFGLRIERAKGEEIRAKAACRT